MTLPRIVLPGKTFSITRRTEKRTFWLRPCEEVRQTFLFLLAAAQEKYGLGVHAFCVMSNHYHLVATDFEGNLPDCLRWLNSLAARALNPIVGNEGCLWEPESYGRVELLDERAAVEQLVYVTLNPVRAGLVRRFAEWPGVNLAPCRGAGGGGAYALAAERPKFFFRRGGGARQVVPERASLRVTLPPVFEGQDPVEVGRRIEGELYWGERAARQDARRAGKKPLGPAGVRAQDRRTRPSSPSGKGRLRPTVACKDPKRRSEWLRSRREWHAQYRRALEGQRARLPGAIDSFPRGTWWWVKYGGATTSERAPPGPSSPTSATGA